MLDILSATETGLAAVACLEQNAAPCARCGECLTLPVWQGLDKVVKDYLGGITLQDVLDRRNVGNDYVI